MRRIEDSFADPPTRTGDTPSIQVAGDVTDAPSICELAKHIPHDHGLTVVDAQLYRPNDGPTRDGKLGGKAPISILQAANGTATLDDGKVGA